VSTSNKPRPASEVNIVGKVTGKLSILKNIKSGDKITVNSLKMTIEIEGKKLSGFVDHDHEGLKQLSE
jgi:hypothetical protein